MKITGIILAEGESKRMGIDKTKVSFNGKNLIEYPINLFRNKCSEILISSNNNNLPEYPYLKIKDKIKKKGPLSGIYSCLKESTNNVNVVISCDMPLINSEFLDYLIENYNNKELIMPYYNSHFEPLIAIYSKSLIPKIEELFAKKDYSPLSLIPVCNFKKLEINNSLNFFNPDLFKNINTSNDLNSVK